MYRTRPAGFLDFVIAMVAGVAVYMVLGYKHYTCSKNQLVGCQTNYDVGGIALIFKVGM